jgi:hypothetical protein
MHQITRAALALMLSTACAHGAEVVSTFDASAEGWVVANVNPQAHVAADPATVSTTWDDAFGLPAGSLREPDIYSWTFVSAPAQYLGDKSGFFGGSIGADIFIRLTDSATWPAFVLRGANKTLCYPRFSPQLDVWENMSAPLTGAGWRVNDYVNGVPATDADMQEVLADLRGVYILVEWRTGADDTNLDNVRLFVPSACVGDINGDGFTNAADFVILAGNFGASVAPNTSGDLNGDGLVNAGDFVILAGDFGCS